MKRIFNLVFSAAIACGAATGWSQDSRVTQGSQSAHAFLNVAAVGQSIERHAAAEAQPARKRESFLYATGLAGHGPFPTRGGPLDD